MVLMLPSIFVETWLAEPNLVVAMLLFHSSRSAVLSSCSQKVSLLSDVVPLKLRRFRMKPRDVAPETSGRINGRHAPMMPTPDSIIGQ